MELGSSAPCIPSTGASAGAVLARKKQVVGGIMGVGGVAVDVDVGRSRLRHDRYRCSEDAVNSCRMSAWCLCVWVYWRVGVARRTFVGV